MSNIIRNPHSITKVYIDRMMGINASWFEPEIELKTICITFFYNNTRFTVSTEDDSNVIKLLYGGFLERTPKSMQFSCTYLSDNANPYIEEILTNLLFY